MTMVECPLCSMEVTKDDFEFATNPEKSWNDIKKKINDFVRNKS